MKQNEGKKIKGEYRDFISKNRNVIKDTGWKSNTIVADYGNFLAALMKKRFVEPVGIEYMAVGSSGENHNFNDFKTLVESYFGSVDPPTLTPGGDWVWAKPIRPEDITYLIDDPDTGEQETDEVTNKIKINVVIEEGEPSDETFDFFEFALLGTYRETPGSDLEIYFVNHVKHEQISKDNTMEINRTVKLTFPVNTNEEDNNE